MKMIPRNDPTITAPISRNKRRHHRYCDNSTVIVLSVMAIVTIILSFLFARSVMILSSNNDNSSDSSSTDKVSLLTDEGRDALVLRRRIIIKEESPPTNNGDDDNNKYSASTLLIHTKLGDITIHFTPEYSGMSSIQYIIDVVHNAAATAKVIDYASRVRAAVECQQCKFYRAETSLLLQGIIAYHSPILPSSTTVNLGPCPIINANYDIPNTKGCPPHDPNCGCHGPIMTRGMVGWAGGKAGPDFFIVTHATPVEWWENQHTVWGIIRDDVSLMVVESVYDMPAQNRNGMRMLDEEIHFTFELVD